HYILPHYHYLGNYFDVTVRGGVMDGQSIYNLDGFNGEGNGPTFDPPLHLEGATGLNFTCGYDNWTDQTIAWGNGMGEMCVLLALIESEAQIGASVDTFSHVADMTDGIPIYEGACFGVAVKK